MLREELSAATWTEADTASKPLKAAGFTKKQIWAASKKLSVVRKKGGMQGGWYWRLPGHEVTFPEDSSPTTEGSEDSEDSEGSSFSDVESSESSRTGSTPNVEGSEGSVSGILESSKPSESSTDVEAI
jgi:putative DNA primase/helicase